MIMKTSDRLVIEKTGAAGFTLVELAVVIATVAVLIAVLLPALAGTRPNTQAFQCLENQRQLILAWQMYAQDNNDLLPPNDYPYTTPYARQTAATQARMRNWVVGTMEQVTDAADYPATHPPNISELLDPNTVLSPYVTNKAVWQCPADIYIDSRSHQVHVRSYSMNSAVGTVWYSSSTYSSGGSPLGSPVQGGSLSGSAYNPNQTTWLTYGKMSSFSRPGPANTFVIMEENPYSINDGCMDISAYAAPGHTYLIDFPSGNHNGAAGISFADGHVIIHKWLDPRTFSPIVPGQGSTTSTQQTPDDPDCFYLGSITSAPR
jgi:prepilin-type processing-associated H-X9-DG protein